MNVDPAQKSRTKAEAKEYEDNQYLAKIKSIPPLSEEEQQELILSWRKFKDKRARNRVIEANLHLVPPIAKSTTKRFKFMGPTFPTAMFDLIGAGSLGLCNAVEGFDPEWGKPFEHYARRAIRNECIHAAKALLSVVDHPYYAHTPRDIYLDPMLGSAHGRLRPWPEELEVRFRKEEQLIAKLINLRKAGLTLKQTGDKLGMSTTTVWRREQAYISEART